MPSHRQIKPGQVWKTPGAVGHNLVVTETTQNSVTLVDPSARTRKTRELSVERQLFQGDNPWYSFVAEFPEQQHFPGLDLSEPQPGQIWINRSDPAAEVKIARARKSQVEYEHVNGLNRGKSGSLERFQFAMRWRRR